ncbi:adhesin transport system membrane fusion protein [Paraburkholderia sp. RAU2J]|uniref:HlyD family type I secretion periplasmic adaptor subunit n=1 Tax=Paraburkholderia sp. RAU2J TaxID=1938810 RepID=UPI000EB00EE2|nr:HlyD family type I secretion periplasmic adaptor subunit [Paraburkholderia sp. RAU2J]RKT24383.1 adhesin transport system membrane fusion protein [Paraburkholderia sp. RAU2J]
MKLDDIDLGAAEKAGSGRRGGVAGPEKLLEGSVKSDSKTFFSRTPISSTPPRESRITWIIALMVVVFLGWAAIFRLDEVSSGVGKVIPSSKEQVIQSQEGGILVELHVREGDIVQAGQVIAQLDRTRYEATVEESASKLRAAAATAARLTAEVNGTALVFPPDVALDKDLVLSETSLFQSRQKALNSTLSDLSRSIDLIRRELDMTLPLVTKGAASDVEVLRLKRQIADLEGKQNDARNDYYVKAREELARANAEVDAQRSVTRGREDSLTHLTFKSPVRGVVKNIAVTTHGGVVAPGGELMTIVPMDEKLLVEARISPRDVAFIHPGQEAMVKITAYDYSIYGGLRGKVTVISPDTIQDEVKRDVYYYRVYIRTDADHLVNRKGKIFPIVPGMVATVDIRTGSKTVLEYLIKPLNRAREALRER